MFEGSKHHDKGYFQPLQGAGASLNGSTNADRTNYWEVVPTNALELALWMESDRMGYLLPALTDAKFSNQRDVVLNERRQNYENRPYGLAPMAMLAALFPPDHPYHWTTIGEIADLHARTHRRRPRRSSAPITIRPTRRWRSPATSTAARRSIWCGATSRICRPGPHGRAGRAGRCRYSTGEQRLLLEDRVELPRLYLAWLTPAMFADGRRGTRSARRTCSPTARRRGCTGGLSTSSGSPPTSRRRRTRARSAGFLQVAATAAPGHTLAELERAIVEEIARLAAEGPTDDEIDRGRVQAEAQFVFRLQNVGGFGGKSDQLNAYNVFLGDPDYFERDLVRYQAVTRESLQQRGRSAIWRTRGGVALSIVPRGQSRAGAGRFDAVA